MNTHKFSVGDRVRLNLARYVECSPSDVHTVSRRLPAEANTWQYRVKRVSDGQERTVTEDQIVSTNILAPHSAAHTRALDAQQDLQRARNARARATVPRSERGRPN